MVYDNVTSLSIEKGYIIRGVYVSLCTLLPEAPGMPLEVIGYESEAISADLESMAIPESSVPAEYTDYDCFTWLYLGNKKVTLLASQFTEGVLLF